MELHWYSNHTYSKQAPFFANSTGACNFFLQMVNLVRILILQGIFKTAQIACLSSHVNVHQFFITSFITPLSLIV